MSRVAIEPIRLDAVSVSQDDSSVSKPVVCFKCGAFGHKASTCKGHATEAGKKALKAHREEVGRRAKFRKDKKPKRGGDGGDVLSAALHDALDKASADAKSHEVIAREKNELSLQVAALENENSALKRWCSNQDEALNWALRDASRNFEFAWQELTVRDFHGLWMAAGVAPTTFVAAFVRKFLPPYIRQHKLVRIALAAYFTISACALYVSYLKGSMGLLLQVVTAQSQYAFGRNTYVMRYVARVTRVFTLSDEERRDLRPDSTSLQEVKHFDCRLAEIEYYDRLTTRRTSRVISVELFVQNTTGLNINYLDAPDVIKARVFQNVPRNMSIALNRYDVLNGRHVVNDTADAVVCFSQAIREKRRLETPGF